MAIIKDIKSNIGVVDFQRYASRTAASYTAGDIKNMEYKEGGVLFLLDIVSVTTSVAIKFSHAALIGDTYVDIATGTAVAIPGPGSMGAVGTVASAAGVHTFTVAGKFYLQLMAKDYKQFMKANWITVGGASAFSISAVAVGSELPIAS